jgi:GDP-4-dehydro-6-deoxy-D-mannose reductase
VRCFVTGIGGFAGSHLAETLLAAGHDVTGTVTDARARPRLRALAERHAGFDLERLVTVDVTDRDAVTRAVAAAAPEWVFHLAAIAFAPRAEADPARTFAVNVLGTVHVLDALKNAAPAARALVSISSEAYGAVAATDLPVTEAAPFRPANVYGVSKAAADLATFQRWWATETPVVRVRAFNHTGPGQSADFVCSDFARQIARAEAGLAPPVLKVGNLVAERDFSDVRDIVRGYALLIERGSVGEAYNLCSGAATSVKSIVEMLVAESRTEITYHQEQGRLRANEVPRLVGSAAKAAALGWSPTIPLRQTVREVLQYWRQRLAADPNA